MCPKTYETLTFSNVFSIANYGAAVWGFKEYHNSRILQNKIIRYYLGTHHFTSLAAAHIEMDWADNRHLHWIEMLWLKNRINQIPTSRWPRRVWQWDRVSKTDAWFKDVKYILSSVDMKSEGHWSSPVDLVDVANKLQSQARNSWLIEAENKPKLRTFLKIHNFDKLKYVISGNLTRSQRSLVVKLKSGIVPIHLETGRYKGLPEEQRVCKICQSGQVESEMHHLYDCINLQYVRHRHPVFREAKHQFATSRNKKKWCLK